MEELEFACVLEEIQKSLNLNLNSDIISCIYDQYAYSYDTYCLFELYALVKQKAVKIETPMMNWQSLVDIIKTEKLDIPPKKITDFPLAPIWYVTRDRYDQFSICIMNPKFEIMVDDIIIMPDGFRYNIEDIYFTDPDVYTTDNDSIIKNACMICLFNLDTDEYVEYAGWDFMYYLDWCDVQFEKSNWLDYVNR